MKKKALGIFAVIVISSTIFTSQISLAIEDQIKSNPSANNQKNSVSATISDTENNDGIKSKQASEEKLVLYLSLENALEMIETNNKALQLTDSKIAIYEKQYEQALAKYNAKHGEVDADSAKDNRLNHKRALWTLENARHDREVQLKNLRAQIIDQYQNILVLQEQVKNYEQQIKNVETIIKQTELQFDLGLITESQMYSLKYGKSSLEAGLRAAQNNIKSGMIALKRDLGIDINREIILTSDLIPYNKYDDSDINEKIAKAIENDYDKKRYNEDIELTEIEYKIASDYSTGEEDQLQISIEDKRATLESLSTTKEVSLRTAYNNLKSLEHSIEAAKLAVEADQINLELLQKKIDAGIASPIEIIQLQNNLLNDQYTLLQQIKSYNTAVTNFINSLEQ